ncbi:hypothetical protein Y032_0040g170 [Ancylostoma ceylanicum]|uniref:NAD/GMP synthase domain-containing protein n=1 Tax=Ancylostoma ceylanicum TaxID=53326 RepID=A0A016UHR0_9BILA|nr:hypothetical protein Y032_0040g170 [Ancylostoma ceylanicum]
MKWGAPPPFPHSASATDRFQSADDPAYYLNGEYVGEDPAELCSKVLFTCYMASEHSSAGTRACADGLANDINSNHSSVFIDTIVSAVLTVFSLAQGFVPSFSSKDPREGLALQNIQARLRMVLAYLFAQLCLIAKGRTGGLLVLGSSNVDEMLVGYMTKYDCSSADINPIGSISKADLRKFLRKVHDDYGMTSLKAVIESVPTAELTPLVDGEVAQTDEVFFYLNFTSCMLWVFAMAKCIAKCLMYYVRLSRAPNLNNEPR